MSCVEVSLVNTFSSKVGTKGTVRVLLLHSKYSTVLRCLCNLMQCMHVADSNGHMAEITTPTVDSVDMNVVAQLTFLIDGFIL